MSEGCLRELLRLAGQMADAARNVVGGPHITIGHVSPATVFTLGYACEALRKTVDEYDRAIQRVHHESRVRESES